MLLFLQLADLGQRENKVGNTETQLKKQVTKYLKTVPGLWFYHPADRWITGIPDFIICYKGRFIAIELKIEGKSLNKMQEYILNKIQWAEGKIGTAHNVEEVKEIIDAA